MLLERTGSSFTHQDDFVDVCLLPNCVLVLLTDDVTADDVRLEMIVDGRSLALPAITAEPWGGLADRGSVVALRHAGVDSLADQGARLQVWVHGFLLQDQPLSSSSGYVSGGLRV